MNNLFKCLNLLVVIMLLASCQTHFSSTDRKVALVEDRDVINLDERLDDGRHVQKVDNLIFLVDDSTALLKRYDGFLQRDLVFALVTRMQRTIPGIKLVQGLRIFGPNADEYDFKNTLLYGMALSRESKIRPLVVNNTPDGSMFNAVGMALDAEYQELRDIPGKTAIIILSAFKGDNPQKIIDSAAMMDNFYHQRVSIYPVLFAAGKGMGDKRGYLRQMAINGFAISASKLREPDKLADFMEDVLFSISTPPPVLRQTGKEVPAAGKNDSTPLSHKKLLKEKELRVKLNTQFDFDKAVIRPEYIGKLKAVAEFMLKYPETSTIIEGHTCSMGAAAYNLKLSARRAQAVKDFLVHAGVAAKRLAIAAYGETRPIADNNTVAGRERNRRVVAVIKTLAHDRVHPVLQEVNAP